MHWEAAAGKNANTAPFDQKRQKLVLKLISFCQTFLSPLYFHMSNDHWHHMSLSSRVSAEKDDSRDKD